MSGHINDKQMELANNLKMLRRLSDLTQAQVAKLIGISRSAYAYYEAGKILPSIFTLKKLASFYSVSIEFFVEPHADMVEVASLLAARDKPVPVITAAAGSNRGAV